MKLYQDSFLLTSFVSANLYIAQKKQSDKCKEMCFEEKSLQQKIEWKQRECVTLSNHLDEKKKGLYNYID